MRQLLIWYLASRKLIPCSKSLKNSMNNSIYYTIWRLLETYEFEIEIDSLKCIICHKILIDASVGPCQCRYCWKCIQASLTNGNEFCPGNTDLCKAHPLNIENNIIKSDQINNDVSNLIQKCPLKECFHYCAMINMNGHLESCIGKLISCPFTEIGCDGASKEIGKLTDHMLSEITKHSKFLIEWIINIKNEISSFLSKDLISPESQMNTIQRLIEMKMSQSLRSHIDVENETKISFRHANKQIECLRKKLEKLEDLSKELIEENFKNREIIQRLTMDQGQLRKQVDYLQLGKVQEIDMIGFGKSMERLKIESENGNEAKIPSENDLENVKPIRSEKENETGKSEAKIHGNVYLNYIVEIPMEPISIFSWIVAGISRIRSYDKRINSETFWSDKGEYKMNLHLSPCGCERHKGTHLCIEFKNCRNYKGNQGAIKRDRFIVGIKILNKFQPECFISKKKSFICRCNSNSKWFHFTEQEIHEHRVFPPETDTVLVECDFQADNLKP